MEWVAAVEMEVLLVVCRFYMDRGTNVAISEVEVDI